MEGFITKNTVYCNVVSLFPHPSRETVPIPKNLPRVFLEIAVDDVSLGKLIIVLRRDIVPRAVQNFINLCTGEDGLGYKGSRIFSIIPNMCIQGGDITNNNGSGGVSIYPIKYFPSENFKLIHDSPGVLSMVNMGQNRNGSMFRITTAKTNYLDGKHVVIGKVVGGIRVLEEMATYGVQSGKVNGMMVIKDCGTIEYNREDDDNFTREFALGPCD